MKKILVPALILFWAAACSDPQTIDLTTATAVIYKVSSEDQVDFEVGEEIGTAVFSYNQNFTLVEISVSGLTPGDEHAMHLHPGTLDTPAETHWNQNTTATFCSALSQGIEWKKPFAGDIGNISIDENGSGSFRMSTDLWSLGTGDDRDISNTVLFIHEQPEYFGSDCGSSARLLHSSAKIAGGTILLQSK